MSLSDNLAVKDGEILKLKEQLYDQGQENAILLKSLNEKSQTAMDLGKEVGKIVKSSTEKEERIKGLVEKLQLKETEVQLMMCTHLYLNVLYKLLALYNAIYSISKITSVG